MSFTSSTHGLTSHLHVHIKYLLIYNFERFCRLNVVLKFKLESDRIPVGHIKFHTSRNSLSIDLFNITEISLAYQLEDNKSMKLSVLIDVLICTCIYF